MADLGTLKPVYGQWIWPLKSMEVGDFFLVDRADRDVADVRNYVAVRGHRIGRSFTVTTEGGFAKVERVPYGQTREARKPVMEYETARERFMEWFGVYLDDVPLGQLEVQRSLEADILLYDEGAPSTRVVFKLLAMTIGVEVHLPRRKLVFHRLPPGWTPKVWEKLYDQWKAQIDPWGDESIDQRLLQGFELESDAQRADVRAASAKLMLDRLKADPVKYQRAIDALKVQDLLS